MHTTLGTLLALWGAFLVLFSRRIALGQHPREGAAPGAERAAAGRSRRALSGTHRRTTALNAVIGAVFLVCGVLVALRVVGG